MPTKNHISPNSKWYPVFSFIKFLIYYLVFDNIYDHIFLPIFGPTKGFLCASLCMLLIAFVIETVQKKWQSFFTGVVYGSVSLKSDSILSTPIKDVEISWGPSHYLTKRDLPVVTNAKGEFHFENLPLRPSLTLTVKLPSNRYIHQGIGDFEGVRWFLGLRWLGFPISPGVPKRVDFVVPAVEYGE